MKVPRLSDLVDPSPWTMTRRARVYLGAAGARHFFIGTSLLFFPWLFSAAAFIPIFNLIPLDWWSIIMTAEGILCGAAALLRNVALARWGMGISAVITLVLGAGLTFGIVGAWILWVHQVGPDMAMHIILTRPMFYPPDLLGLGPAPPSPVLPIILLTLTVKDFAVCAQPLRVPLEAEWAGRLPWPLKHGGEASPETRGT